jgi:hypothetical protein
MDGTIIPQDFNWKFYLEYYEDLRNAGLKTKEDAERHYLNHGYCENRIYTIDYSDLLKTFTKQINEFKSNNFETPIYIFYHVYCKNEWKLIVDEQIKLIKQIGLFDESKCIFFVINGDKKSYNYILSNYENPKISFIRTNEKYEFPTLDIIKKISESNKFKGLYLHTKGVTKSNFTSSWRKVMNFYNINLWRNNYSVLDKYDIAGCNFKYGNITISDYWNYYDEKNTEQEHPVKYTDHFSGNFWWFNSEYMNKLRYLSSEEKNNRFNAEWYIFKGFPKFFNWATPKNLSSNFTELEFRVFSKKVINKNMIFKDSILAHKYLDGLIGIEIGASCHNPFNLKTINVDKESNTFYESEQLSMCNSVAKVDVTIKDATILPFENKSYDFIINSHVIEHIYRPDLAIIEWCRVAKKYIFLIIPHKERTFDKDKLETEPLTIFERENLIEYQDQHYNIWTPKSFLNFVKYLEKYVQVIEVQEIDDKVGNGFTVVLKIK